jgi:hypothetical protein
MWTPIVYAYAMSTDDSSFTDMWSGFLASVWTQVRAAQVVGLPAEDESRSVAAHETIAGDQLTRPEVRSMDDYAGYLTGSGLGSLDIGGGSSRWGE